MKFSEMTYIKLFGIMMYRYAAKLEEEDTE